jgi:hypothetical protein
MLAMAGHKITAGKYNPAINCGVNVDFVARNLIAFRGGAIQPLFKLWGR